MCVRQKRESNQNRIERWRFTNKHDSRIFVEPFDFFHVLSGLDFSRSSVDKILDRFEKDNGEEKNSYTIALL